MSWKPITASVEDTPSVFQPVASLDDCMLSFGDFTPINPLVSSRIEIPRGTAQRHVRRLSFQRTPHMVRIAAIELGVEIRRYRRRPHVVARRELSDFFRRIELRMLRHVPVANVRPVAACSALYESTALLLFGNDIVH